MMRRFLLAIALLAAAVVPVPAQAPALPLSQAPSQASQTPLVQGSTYNADGRRDPFLSLLRRGLDINRGPGGRAPGLAGLSVSEIVLKGTVASQGGFVAMVQGVDNRTYTARPGDKLFDGVVRGISQDAMVLLQQVNDPLSLEKQREVRKVLRQTEEVK